MKIRVTVSIGLVGCKRDKIIEVPDDEAEDEANIEDYAQEAMFEMIEWGWKPIEP